MPRFSRSVLVACVLALAACDSADPDTPGTTPPPTPSTDPIGGVYQATIPTENGSLRLALDVPPTPSGAFTLGSGSSGTSTVGSTVYPLTVSGGGTYTPPDLVLDLTLARDGSTQTVRFTGTAGNAGTAITLRDPAGAETVLTRR